MRLLHTSDWHVGKAIRGQSRIAEHRAVLAEIAEVARGEEVDAVLVVGDLFETAAPAPEAEEVVYRALLDLAAVAPVVAVGGNHDNPRRLEAVAPLLHLGGVHLLGAPARPGDGGLLTLPLASGEELRVARLPFVSQRGIVRAEELLELGRDERSGLYRDRVAAVVAALCDGFTAEAVNVVAAHLFVEGGLLGGGERSGHTIFDYSVPTVAFPASAHYVALGHLHRAQALAGPTQIRYCGSPLQLDFGEEADAKSVTIVEASPGRPATTREVALRSGCSLRTLTGTLDELRVLVDTTGDDWLRIRVSARAEPGLADEVRTWFPRAVDIQLVRPDAELAPSGKGSGARLGGSPVELFGAYLDEQDIEQETLLGLFAELLNDVEAAST
jgi:DNA repair protein SbcD/Mre11